MQRLATEAENARRDLAIAQDEINWRDGLEHQAHLNAMESQHLREQVEFLKAQQVVQQATQAASGSGGRSNIKAALETYDGSGDLDRWAARTRQVFLYNETPARKQVQAVHLTALQGPALVHLNRWSLEEINTLDFERLVVILKERFELTIKQCEHQETLRSIKLQKDEGIEIFYEQFTLAKEKVKPKPTDDDQYWSWYFAMPNWLRDRLTMLNATTLHQAVDITRKAVAGVTIAYHPGSSGHGNTPMPHSPTPMEINALRGTHAAGPRRRGRSAGPRRDRKPRPVVYKGSGKGLPVGTGQGHHGQAGKGDGRSPFKKWDTRSRNPARHQLPLKPNMGGETCNRCGGKGHWARDCPTTRNKPPGK